MGGTASSEKAIQNLVQEYGHNVNGLSVDVVS